MGDAAEDLREVEEFIWLDHIEGHPFEDATWCPYCIDEEEVNGDTTN